MLNPSECEEGRIGAVGCFSFGQVEEEKLSSMWCLQQQQ